MAIGRIAFPAELLSNGHAAFSEYRVNLAIDNFKSMRTMRKLVSNFQPMFILITFIVLGREDRIKIPMACYDSVFLRVRTKKITKIEMRRAVKRRNSPPRKHLKDKMN